MPQYEYRVLDGHEGCTYCRNVFVVVQAMKDEKLAACPKCGAPVDRLLFANRIATPHGPAYYKNIGFKKLVKRDDGVYENLTAQGDESRYMERGKADTLPDVGSVIPD